MVKKKGKKKHHVFINGFTTWGVIQLSRKFTDMSKLQTIKFPGQNRSHLLTSKFCRRKISTSNCTHHSSTRSFFRKKWLVMARANWKTNLEESQGIPGGDFRCGWLTPLSARFENMDFSANTFADAVRGQEINCWWRSNRQRTRRRQW